MAEKTTSAGQLYEILVNAYAQSDNTRTMDVWNTVLQPESYNQLYVTKKLGELINLFDLVKKDFQLLDSPFNEIGLNALFSIQSPILNHGLITTWGKIKNEINSQAVSNIKLCEGILLAKKVCQDIIDREKINLLIEQVSNLIEEFRTSNLPDELKFELINELVKIQTALLEFDIKGEANIQKVCNEVLGDITTKSSMNPSLFKKFLDSDVVKVVGLVSSIVTLNGGFVQPPNKYQSLLENAVITYIKTLPDESAKQARIEGFSD